MSTPESVHVIYPHPFDPSDVRLSQAYCVTVTYLGPDRARKANLYRVHVKSNASPICLRVSATTVSQVISFLASVNTTSTSGS